MITISVMPAPQWREQWPRHRRQHGCNLNDGCAAIDRAVAVPQEERGCVRRNGRVAMAQVVAASQEDSVIIISVMVTPQWRELWRCRRRSSVIWISVMTAPQWREQWPRHMSSVITITVIVAPPWIKNILNNFTDMFDAGLSYSVNSWSLV